MRDGYNQLLEANEGMRIDVITLFPEMFEAVFEESIIKRAREKNIVQIVVHNLRDYSSEKHGQVDDKPYGGGAGMVLQAPPVFSAVRSIGSQGKQGALILTSPQGQPFDQELARRFSIEERLILLCGHYTGVDERVRIGLKPIEVSMGDFVLTGGEIPAMAIVDAVVRLLPETVGDLECITADSFWNNLLGPPLYTRPRTFEGMMVPQVLLSGDHEAIEGWRRQRSFERTRHRRADLLDPDEALATQSDSDTLRSISEETS